MIGSEKKSLMQLIDLTRLPVQTQSLLATLLLLPFGALITAWFRLIIGMRTLSTFTATLLALAMVYTDWFTVTFLVTVVAIISFGGLLYVAGTFSRSAPGGRIYIGRTQHCFWCIPDGFLPSQPQPNHCTVTNYRAHITYRPRLHCNGRRWH